MQPSNKIAHSRLLYADLISDVSEEMEIIKKIKNHGFTASAQKDNIPIKFSTDDPGKFIGQLQSVCKYDTNLLEYVDNVFFWIYGDSILPLKVVIAEVILKSRELQEMQKPDLERKIWKLSQFLANCFSFSEIATALNDPNNDFRIFRFSCGAIPNRTIRNFVAEFFVQTRRESFDAFNKLLNTLEQESFTKNLIEQTIKTTTKNAKIPESKVESAVSRGIAKRGQSIAEIRSQLISLEPFSFYGDGFSHDKTIVTGYATEVYIIGKFTQERLYDSPPLYFSFIGMGEIPRANLENMPALEIPGIRHPLDFSFGAGQLLAMQLLNSWNRHVEKLVVEITTQRNELKIKTKNNTDETLEELRKLIFHTSIDEKISVNYRKGLQDLADPSKKTFLREIVVPTEEGTPFSKNPEQFGLERPGPIVSNLAFRILNNLDLNEKNLLDAISIRKSKIDLLKIVEDRRYSRYMFCLTIVIAIATIINVVVSILARII